MSKQLNDESLQKVTGGTSDILAAEEILCDEDLAKEATELAKTSVTQQAEQAMIAQSNQSMQNILSLLQ